MVNLVYVEWSEILQSSMQYLVISRGMLEKYSNLGIIIYKDKDALGGKNLKDLIPGLSQRNEKILAYK